MKFLLKSRTPMSNNLPTTAKDSKLPNRIMRALGPLVTSLSKEASEKYAEHLKRLADVEVAKESMLLEVRMYADLKKQLMEKFINATPVERFQIRNDIEEIDKEARKIGVYQQAVEVIENIPEQNRSQLTLEHSQHEDAYTAWIDTFNEYAKKQNEPWRQALLAQALAKEATNPGSIGQRALWFIGTIDQRSFNAFAALLNVSISIGGSYVLPNQEAFLEKPIATAALGYNVTLGNVVFLINDLGLIGDLMTSQRIFPSGALFAVSYGKSNAQIQIKQELRISGVILTPLGEIIAQMYKPEVDSLGKEVYEKWIETAKTTPCDVLTENKHND